MTRTKRSKCSRFCALIMVAGAAAVLLGACDFTSAAPTSPPTAHKQTVKVKEAPVIAKKAAALPQVSNDLASGSAHHIINPPGEAFGLNIDYWTDTDATRWSTLGTKTIDYSTHLVIDPGILNLQVVVQRFHVEADLLSTNPALNGLDVASYDDNPPSANLPAISGVYSYGGSFTANGYSQTLINRWQYAFGSTHPLTEANLKQYGGVYGTQFKFVFELMVKSYGDQNAHELTINDAINVPAPVG